MNSRESTPEVQILPSHQNHAHLYTSNTPRSRQETAALWASLKRLQPTHPEYSRYTHICKLDDCNALVKLSRSKPDGPWATTAGISHFSRSHSTHPIAMESSKKKALSQANMAAQQLNFTLVDPSSAEKRVALKRVKSFNLSNNFSNYLSAQVKWYCYSPMRVSKTTLEDPYFRNQFSALVYPEVPPFLNAKSLSTWITAEFKVFLTLLRYILNEKQSQAHGNSFAQLLHDGGTLENKKKFQAVGLQFVDPQNQANHVVSIGFFASLINTDESIAEKLKLLLEKRTGLVFENCISSMMQDRAALGVSSQLEIESEACLMHDVVNPFQEGVALVKKAHSVGTYFSQSEKRRDSFENVCNSLTNCANVRIQVDLNTTRISSCHQLLFSIFRVNRGLRAFMSLPSEKNTAPCPKLSEEEWTSLAEIEGILECTRLTTKLAQTEQQFNGAYKNLIVQLTAIKLRALELKVVDQAAIGTSPVLPRTNVAVTHLTTIGQTCRNRAILEVERRFCGNDTETATGASFECSDRQLLATLLDLQTVKCEHLTSLQRNRAKELLFDQYVSFAEQYTRFEFEAPAAAEKTMKPVSKIKKWKQSALSDSMVSGVKYGGSGWTDDEDDCSEDELPVLPPMFQFNKEAARIEGVECFKRWRTMDINWNSFFPNVPSTDPDLVDDLMDIDIGLVYNNILELDPKREKYGFLPLMATCSKGQIGALPAESYCERMLSCANSILTEGNTLLGEIELEMLVLLRMNRDFMVFMREHYSHVNHQLTANLVLL
ncbi:hypothetical protein BDR26DRAFT_932541 [Obelidium mucronatum]|nr:hypothetical protein BDR26DRAFT_932541 [Obelidium mucronatum]